MLSWCESVTNFLWLKAGVKLVLVSPTTIDKKSDPVRHLNLMITACVEVRALFFLMFNDSMVDRLKNLSSVHRLN